LQSLDLGCNFEFDICFTMSTPADFSSDLQRMFFDLCQLETDEQVEAYLDRECGDDTGQREMLRQLLSASNNNATNTDSNPLVSAEEKLRGVDETIAGIASQLAGPIEDLIVPVVDRYEIDGLLGEGNMGRVFLATQTDPVRRKVALKVIKPGMDSEQVLARFEREKQILATLDHPNISKVFDAGMTSKGYPFFSMELVRGEPIDSYCSSRALSIDARLRLMIQVCAAVQHAHKNEIVHRDLKPANVLVTTLNDQPVVKVIDFGVAKALTSDASQPLYQTYFRQSVGTPMYMSPEQLSASGSAVDQRSDVYALGGVLYHLLAGAAPLKPNDPSEIGQVSLREYIETSAPIEPSKRLLLSVSAGDDSQTQGLGIPASQIATWVRRVRGDLDAVALKALEKSPSARYESAQALADDLTRFLDGLPVQAKTQGLGGKMLAALKQRTAAAAFVLTAVIVAVIGLVMYELRAASKRANDALIEKEEVLRFKQDALVKKETESQDRLEAMQLQSQIKALSLRDAQAIADIELPRMTSGEFLGEQTDWLTSKPYKGSLRHLLLVLSNPKPALEMQNGASIDELAMSPDHRFAATACEDAKTRIWDVTSGELVKTLGPLGAPVTAVRFSPDGSKLATGDGNGWITLWDVTSILKADTEPFSRQIGKVRNGDRSVESIAWSADGSKVAVGCRYGAAVVYTEKLEEVFRVDHGKHHPRNERIFLSEDGRHLYLGNKEHCYAEKWDVEQKTNLWPAPPLGTGYLQQPVGYPRCFVPFKNSLLYSLVNSASIAVLDADSGRFHGWISSGIANVRFMSISPDQRHLVTAHSQGGIVVSKLIQNNDGVPDRLEMLIHYQGHPDSCDALSVEFIDNDRFITSGTDGSLRVWDLNEVQFRQEIPVSQKGWQAFLDDGSIVEFAIRSQPTNNVKSTPKLTPNDSTAFKITEVDFQSDVNSNLNANFSHNRLLAAQTANCVLLRKPDGVEIFDLVSGKRLGEIESELGSRDGDSLSMNGRLNFLTRKNTGLIWETKDRWKTSRLKAEFELISLNNNGISSSIAVAASGEFVVYTALRCIIVANVDSGDVVWRFPMENGCNFTLSPSERSIAMFDESGVQVHDLVTGEQILKGRLPFCKQAQFVDDERILLTLDTENAVHAWHLPTTTDLGVVYQAPEGTSIDRFLMSQASKLCVMEWDENQKLRRFSVMGN
jgi:eukaryotic-like serine/threonine-protein kinase